MVGPEGAAGLVDLAAAVGLDFLPVKKELRVFCPGGRGLLPPAMFAWFLVAGARGFGCLGMLVGSCVGFGYS